MIIRAGFRYPCYPAGNAVVDVTGDMDSACVADVIELLELVIRKLRRQIEQDQCSAETINPDRLAEE